ncbi:chemotaxis protein CheX [Pseudoroseomonas rhizosphaerae]|uniref:Chemotaxis protein CheX n=1 Tax=Teichococcus rhizosphaerae TaxID=1335062 RepID=A0A2C7A6Q4_9PROT|nr:chemotaxis protein CheX [Pseudoroseomonas rhizosphaerae]PHK93293.1 chemotaxis protein CheX [Pseudoroseomonas rhizosphaerae]
MNIQILLNELERDALTEIVNIGVSRAAASLRRLIGAEVLLSVPSAEVVSRSAAAAMIADRESEPLVTVRQDFAGSFSGRALLILPAANGASLVRAVLGEAVDDEEALALRDETLTETGNLVLNNCLGTMANMLRESLTLSLPDLDHGGPAALFAAGAAGGEEAGGVVLFLYINFSIRNHDIRGYIAMLMDMPSLTMLQQLIAGFISSVMDDTAGGA